MIKSMTGFGQGQAHADGERFAVTLKSVNHRYFETSFHLPPHLEYLEGLVRGRLQQVIKRGRVTISISHANEASDDILVNEALIEKYYRTLEHVRKRLKIASTVEISSLMSLPGVLRAERHELKEAEREKLVRSALDGALKKLVVMRQREGVALAKDLARRAKKIEMHMGLIRRRIAGVIEGWKKNLPPENLESFLRSTDVSEEITRIDFHLKSLTKHMKSKEPVGKVLDFVGQELQREINTLGAKVQDKHVAFEVVMVKDLIEKIREQVQNVE